MLDSFGMITYIIKTKSLNYKNKKLVISERYNKLYWKILLAVKPIISDTMYDFVCIDLFMLYCVDLFIMEGRGLHCYQQCCRQCLMEILILNPNPC